MQFATLIANLTFCSMLLCLCYGAPPSDSSRSINNPRHYSEEEEWFIINQMRIYPRQWLPVWGQEIWIEIAKKHCEVRELDGCMFPPRTPTALGNHFQKMMLYSKGKVKLPDDLSARIVTTQKKEQGEDSGPSNLIGNEDQNVSRGAHLREIHMRNKYTREEDEFIVNFVKNYSVHSKPTFGDKMWVEAAKRLEEVRKLDPSNFPFDRSSRALRERLRRISQKSSNKKQKNKETTTPNEEMLANRAVHLRDIRKRNKYNIDEDKFIVNFVMSYSRNPGTASADKLWDAAAEQLKEIRKANPSKFPLERSGAALRERLRRMLQKPAIKKWSNTEKAKDLVGSASTAEEEEQEEENASLDDMIQELLAAPYDIDFNLLKGP